MSSLVFSLILPTHNRADVIKYAIESVLWQTEQDFELLIVGDGCTDDTAKVVKPYLKDSRIQWFDLPKAPGFGQANRNLIFKKAKGKYIGFVAHDDIIFPDHLALLRKLLDDSSKIDIVYSRPLWVNRRGDIIPSSFNLDHPKMLKHFLNVGNAIPASCFVHRRSCFKEVGYWDENIAVAADWDFYKRVINSKKHKNFAYETLPTAMHFLASWRKDSDSWPHMQLAQQLRRQRAFPRELRAGKKSGRTEQEIIWQFLKKDPLDAVSVIRKACDAMLDYSNNYLPGQRRVEAENSVLRDDIGRLNQDVTKLNHDYDDMIQAYENSRTMIARKRIMKLVKPGSVRHRALSAFLKAINKTS